MQYVGDHVPYVLLGLLSLQATAMGLDGRRLGNMDLLVGFRWGDVSHRKVLAIHTYSVSTCE